MRRQAVRPKNSIVTKVRKSKNHLVVSEFPTRTETKRTNTEIGIKIVSGTEIVIDTVIGIRVVADKRKTINIRNSILLKFTSRQFSFIKKNFISIPVVAKTIGEIEMREVIVMIAAMRGEVKRIGMKEVVIVATIPDQSLDPDHVSVQTLHQDHIYMTEAPLKNHQKV